MTGQDRNHPQPGRGVRQPVADLFVDQAEAGLALIGSRCGSCAAVTFPRQPTCPRCAGSEMRDERLATRGTLWSWTVQAFAPKSPPFRGEFTPYGVGYIQLEDQVIVEARLTESDPDRLHIGSVMELVALPVDDDTFTYAFAPVTR